MSKRGAARYYPGFGDRVGKVYPEHIAGILGLAEVGNIWYVDANKSSSGGGTSRADAFVTVAEALAAATADNDDVILIASKSSTGRTSETSSITWSKRRTHLIGNGGPRRINSRNGMSFTSAATTPSMTISANNCIFANVSIAQFNDVNVLLNITGNYNTFINCHFQGIGNATTGDDTAGRSVVLTGAEENEFINCTFGLDTVARSAANASLELTGSCPRNKFINCDFPAYADNAGVLFVKADTGNCYERFLKFENCTFTNAIQGSATTMTVGMDLSTTGNGSVYMMDCWWHGCTDLVNNVTNVQTNNRVVDTADAGVFVVHANS